MKRVLILLVVVFLAAAGAVYFMSHQGAPQGTQLVSADTVFYAALPDLRQSIERWPKTALAQIGAEPTVAEFLKKPTQLLASKGGLEGLDLLLRVKPGRAFVAVTTVRPTGADLVLGFQYFGDRKELDGALDRLHREVSKSLPNARRTTADYQGNAITSVVGAGPVLYSAVNGSWGFLATSEAAIKQALDRAAGRDRSPSLANEADFKTVMGHLAKTPDFVWFVRIKPIADVLTALSANQTDAGANSNRIAQLAKIKALGGSLYFDGTDQREATFILYPDAPKLPLADRAPMALTTPETTFYYNSTIDWSTVTSAEYGQSLPPVAQAFLAGAKVDLQQLPKAFGNDLGVIVDWPASSMIPSILAVVEVKDRPAVESLVEGVFTSSGVATTASELHGARVFGFPGSKIQLIDPVVAIGDQFLFGALTSAELERALGVKPGAPTLESAAAFKPALPAYRAEAQAFGYLDSKALFEGVYNRVRPIAIFAAAMSSDVGKFVDVNKLPETEAISRHLSPIIYGNRQLPDGWLVESSGPVTLSQAFFAGIFGASAAYFSQAMKGAQP